MYPQAILVIDDPEAVVLQFVKPAVAGRHVGGKRRPARKNEPGRSDELRVRINMARRL